MSGRILVAHELTELSDRALAWAADYARLRGAAVTILHVVPLPPPPVAPEGVLPVAPLPEELAELEQRLREAAARCGLSADVEVIVAANVGTTVVARAERLGAELIALGTHGRGMVT